MIMRFGRFGWFGRFGHLGQFGPNVGGSNLVGPNEGWPNVSGVVYLTFLLSTHTFLFSTSFTNSEAIWK